MFKKDIMTLVFYKSNRDNLNVFELFAGYDDEKFIETKIHALVYQQ